jgi:hypothetical protein
MLSSFRAFQRFHPAYQQDGAPSGITRGVKYRLAHPGASIGIRLIAHRVPSIAWFDLLCRDDECSDRLPENVKTPLAKKLSLNSLCAMLYETEPCRKLSLD